MKSIWGELKRRNVVRVAIAYAIVTWLVLQLTDVLKSLLDLPDWIGGVVFVLLLIGFAIALILSWAYEMTPEGVKLEKDVDRSQSVTSVTGRKLDFVIIGVLSVALVMFAVDKFAGAPADIPETVSAEVINSIDSADETIEAKANTIAVLPFVNMSSDPEQEYFSDGLSEELINLLVRIPELRVTSRTSAFFYKGKDFQIEDVGRELGVAYIMEGSVRRSGDTIRVTAQLVDVGTDTHIWSETWDRKFADVFVIQDEIAAAAVDAMKVSILGDTPKVAETTPAAYTLYLQGRSFFAQSSTEGLRRASEVLERALEIDNEYAPAWVLFGKVQQAGATVGAWEPHEGYPAARAAAMEALRHDENSAEAHLLLSVIAGRYDYDYETSWNEIQIASELAPGNNEVRARRALFSLLTDEDIDGSEELLKALHADPLNNMVRMALGFTYMYSDRSDEAIGVFEEVIELNPNVAGVHYRLAQILITIGEYDDALAALDNEVRDGFVVAGRALVFQAQGNSERSAEELQKLTALGNVWTYEIAMVHAYRGEIDEAFDWLDRALGRRDQSLTAMVFDPFMPSLHDDPRFDLVIEQLGQTDLWEIVKEQR